jgi:hypothetical protein
MWNLDSYPASMAAPHSALLPLIRGDEIPPGTRVTPEVVSSAEEHGVAALLDHEVERRSLDIGLDLRTRLAMSALGVAAENHNAQAAVTEAMQIAEALGIGIAIFKGVTIGHRFYRYPVLRPTIDVDVFVNPAQIDRFGEFFAALGGPSSDIRAVEAMVGEGRVFEHSIPLSGTSIDLHRDPMNMVLVPRQEQDVWDMTIEIELSDGTSVRTLDLEWTIVHSLLNGFRDNFADLVQVYDLDLMFDAEPDWDRISKIVRVEGWTDMIRYAMAFVSDALGRPSPLPRRAQRSSLVLLRKFWSEDRLLKGVDSAVTSVRRQSALSLLTLGRRRDLAWAYARRVAPPRTVIELRSAPSEDSYPVALYRWRRDQRATNKSWRETIDHKESHETV